MKILYLANARIPSEKAHGVQIMKMVEALAKAGHQVKLIIPRRYNPKFKNQDPFKFYAVNKNFIVKKIWVIDILRWIINWGPLGTWLLNASFALSSFFYGLFNPTNLIYSRDALPLLFISLFKKNFIYELHEYRAKDKWLYQKLSQRGQGIVVITHQIKQLLIRAGIQTKKILVAADGVDLENFSATNQARDEIRKKLNLPLDKKIILYSGSLYKWKGVYTLAETAKILDNNVIIILVGGMKYDIDRLKKFIQENNLPPDKILILGHKSYQEIPAYLAAADGLVLPNSDQKEISAQYTSPLKMFEYMASQKPIIASDLPSIREVLKQKNAILVKADNSQGLAQGINQALSDQNLVSKIVAQAYQDVQNYTWHKRVEKILNFAKLSK